MTTLPFDPHGFKAMCTVIAIAFFMLLYCLAIVQNFRIALIASLSITVIASCFATGLVMILKI